MRINRIGALGIGLVATAVAATLAAPAAVAASSPYRATPSYTGTVVRIVDGDTVDVRVGNGNRRVQLLDINAPEVGQCWSSTAAKRLAWLLPVGSRVTLRQDGPARDSAGRYLAYAWNRQNLLVNRDLPRQGLAAVKLRPSGLYNAQTRADQDAAKRLHYGIWSTRCDMRGGRSFTRDRDLWIGVHAIRRDRDDNRGDHRGNDRNDHRGNDRDDHRGNDRDDNRGNDRNDHR